MTTPTSYPTLQPTSVPTTRSPFVYDPLVGTADAPTTPGGACLNSADYSLWTTPDAHPTHPTGFDKFVSDVERCATSCGTLLLPIPQSSEYNCGVALSTTTCGPDIYKRCVGDCLGKREPKANVQGILQTQLYTLDCNACMAELANCGATTCALQCAAGSKDSPACQACNENNCNPTFMTCSGLNINMAQHEQLDITPILIGTLGGFAALILFVVLVGYVVHKRNQAKKVMSPEDLARLASAQNNMSMAMPSHTNPAYNPNNSPRAGQTKQYQQQQQRQPSRIAPSVRMVSMASQAQNSPDMFQPTVPLVAIYDFVGERSDELNVTVGTRMFGIEQQDGWWLAKTEKGEVGLIPVSYTETASVSPRQQQQKQTAYVNPDF